MAAGAHAAGTGQADDFVRPETSARCEGHGKYEDDGGIMRQKEDAASSISRKKSRRTGECDRCEVTKIQRRNGVRMEALGGGHHDRIDQT